MNDEIIHFMDLNNTMVVHIEIRCAAVHSVCVQFVANTRNPADMAVELEVCVYSTNIVERHRLLL